MSKAQKLNSFLWFSFCKTSRSSGIQSKPEIWQKNVLDIAKKLDIKNKELRSIEDIISPSFLDGKRQLTETFLSLVNNQELDGLGRIEEAIWRKAFYEPYSLGKQFAQKSGKSDLHLGILRSHLYSAITFYSQFLQQVKASSRQSDGDLVSLQDSVLDIVVTTVEKDKVQLAANKSSRCEEPEDSHIDTIHRIHLYLGDIYRYLFGLGISRAQRIAVQQYFEALNVIPGNGLPHNQLAALFSDENFGLTSTYHYIACMSSKLKFEGGEKNLATKVEDYSNKFAAAAKDNQKERLMLGFNLVAAAFMGLKINQEISQICQVVLKDLHDLLRKSRKLAEKQDVEKDIDSETLLLMAAVCCFILHRNAEKKKDFEVQLAFAFCLAYLSELLDGVLNEISDIMPDIPSEVPKPIPAKSKSRRRRRRRSSLKEGESSCSEVESEESDLSDSDSGSDIEIEESDSDSESKNLILREYEQNQLKARLQNSDYVAPLSLMSHCLSKLQSLLSGAGTGAFPLWTRLAKLSNVFKDVGESPEENLNLPEDWYVSGLWRQGLTAPKETELKVRSKRIRTLTRCLLNLPESGVTYHEPSGFFFCQEKAVETKVEERKLDEDKARTMAAMWLRSEVSALENQLTSASCLVVDTSAMLNQLRAVTKLSKSFIVIIPTAVINQLDRAKKNNADAREAIRWLEQEFQRGSRTVRPQRHGSRKSLPVVKYPKRKEKSAWSFYQILECCLYLKDNTGSESAEVTLLIGESPTALANQLAVKSPQGLCASIGVTIKTAAEFLKSHDSRKDTKTDNAARKET